MGKRVTKSKDYLEIKILILVIMICSSWIIYAIFNEKTNEYKKEHKIYEEKYVKLNKEYNEKRKKLNNLNDTIKKYENIDKSINKIKDEYYKYLKEFENEVSEGRTDKKIVYLTFDDGPYYNTYKVLDILDQYNIKATFFTTTTNGEYCYDNKSVECFNVYKEYNKRGHTIANHTYTHGIFKGLYNNSDTFIDAVMRQEEQVKKYANGYETNIVRFPGGSSTAKGYKEEIINKLRENGYGWVDWTAQDGDGKKLDSNEQAINIFKNTMDSNIEVVLLHDYSVITTNILPEIINYINENNYVALPLFYDSIMINK